MNMRNKLIVTILFLIIGVTIIFFIRPINIIDDTNIIYKVRVNGEVVDDPDKLEDIVNVISKYKMRFHAFKSSSYTVDEQDYLITLSIKNKLPKHMILGRLNSVYESRDKVSYSVINYKELIIELDKITGFTSTNFLEDE